MDALYRLVRLLWSAQLVVNQDSPDNEHVPLQLDFSYGLGSQFAVRGVNVTRFQRAPEGSIESTGGRRNHVIERRGVWRVSVGRNLVVLRDLRVHTEGNR
jgi:hypothetical protein